MSMAYTIVPVAPVRASPSHKAEIVTELLFGETAVLGEKQGEFYKATCSYDGYEGWVQDRQMAINAEGPGSVMVMPIEVKILLDKTILHLSPGSMLPAGIETWSVGPYNFQVPASSMPLPHAPVQPGAESILKTAQQYMGASYLWGGKSIFGLDCSGFTQQVFKISGIKLRRDAWQQAEQGALVGSLDEARPGDLAFFHSESGRINHVGILSSTRTIMHASASARHDMIDGNGIMHRELQEYTHKLHMIRRYL